MNRIKFMDLGISLNVKPGLYPTLNQQKWIPLVQNGQNVILKDATGTGKTFGSALCAAQCNSVFVGPSRDVAFQVYNWMREWSDCSLVLKESEFSNRMITTPQILLRLIENGYRPRVVFMDEIDRIIDMKSNQKSIGKKLLWKLSPFGCQYVVGSATISQKNMKLLPKWIPNPTVFDFNTQLPATIDHYCFVFDNEWKPVQESSNSSFALQDDDDIVLDYIPKVLSDFSCRRTMLFVPSFVSLSKVVEKLQQRGIKADKFINTQDYENQVRKDPFEQVELVVTSEYACRGLDLPNLDTVLMLGPLSSNSYLHCAGRVGRFGNKGRAITLMSGPRFAPEYLEMCSELGIHTHP